MINNLPSQTTMLTKIIYAIMKTNQLTVIINYRVNLFNCNKYQDVRPDQDLEKVAQEGEHCSEAIRYLFSHRCH